MRKTTEVIADIKKLVNKKGYIYSLCLIIMDNFHFSVETIHEIDYRSRLNKNEISLIIGFLIQNKVNLDIPNTPYDLIELKKETYKLMDELHHSLTIPMIDKFKPLLSSQGTTRDISRRDFFGGEDMFIEPIFYSGDGIYDFQYLEFLNKKYKYDEVWLNENVGYYFDKAIDISLRIKKLHQDKIGSINFLFLMESKEKIIKDLRKEKILPKKNKKDIDDLFVMIEFYQYFELFETESHILQKNNPEEISRRGWESFYAGLINLFCVRKNDFEERLNIDSFLGNFSIKIYDCSGLNEQFENIGDFNLFSSRPILQIDSERFFIPVSFSVFESIYESPYYWMQADKKYKDKLARNRGAVGEEITYELLVNVFGKDKVYKSVKIESKKGYTDTDIDVLCILGSKALCVQVKSKKLTQLSRKGDFNQLQLDFKGAVQDAYEQGLLCRERIIDKNALFINEFGSEINILENIDEVFILGVTTENYPSLTHQAFTLLDRKNDNPYPLFLTIFDLELLLYYLDNPYDFLYYVRQRINLMEYFHAEEEIHYLGYHLTNKLYKDPKADFIQIDNSIGQLIDRNYYPYKMGIQTSENNDKIGSRWKNEDFNILCREIAEIKSPKKTDIIFHLLDWSRNSIDNLISQIKITKEKTKNDGEWHNFSNVVSPNRSSFGLTFISWDSNDVKELSNILLRLSKARKYKSKADLWIGIGCLESSNRFVDSIVFSDAIWEFDEELEAEAELLLEGENKGTLIKFGKKIGRNDICPCGSRKKYKKCCGKT